VCFIENAGEAFSIGNATTAPPAAVWHSRTATRILAIVLVLLFFVGFWTVPDLAQNRCACGPKRVLLVLSEFQDYRHLSGRTEVSHLFFGQVARYFTDVSYGKLTVDGNATDWITLPRLYEQYRLSSQQLDLQSIARDSFTTASQTFNFTSFDAVFLVLSFYPSLTADYIQLSTAIGTRTGSVSAFAVIEEDRDWSTYARVFTSMIGLWKNRNQLTGLGQLDISSGGQGDMSAWSKLNLGWLNNSQLITLRVSPVRRIFTVSPIEIDKAETFAVRIDLGQSEASYFIEVRQPIGYDRNVLQEYGVVVLYVPPSNSSIQFRTILQPDIVGRAIFLDLSSDLSVVVLNQTQTGFRVLVGSVQDGRDAQRSLYAISQATDAIRMAESQNRIEGLDLAERLYGNAHMLFALGRFGEAEALAVSSQTTANGAIVPSDYGVAVQLIATAEDVKTSVQALSTQQSQALVVLGNSRLEAAKQAFVAKNFTIAKQDAQAAIDLFNRAKQLDFTDRVIAWLSNLALIIPVAVLVYAIRYQLKSD
jgi:hypothetical protein